MLSLAAIAQRSGRSAQNLRRLARDGRIPAQRVGRDWQLPIEVIASLQERGHGGRPLAAANAWGLLALLSDENPKWVDARVRYRLRRYLGAPERLLRLLASSQARSSVRSYWLPADDLPSLAKEPGLVRSGLASAAPPDFDLFYFEPVLDAYLEQRRLQSLISRYRPLEHANAPNIWLRVPSHRWVLRKDGAAPVAVVAADLLDHPNERVRHAGRRALLNLIDSG
jgi:hypothetical protein